LESDEEGQNEDASDQEDEEEAKYEEGEYTFENGAVYCGQWLGRFRHGTGS
jgi:hypothetical protein